MSKDEFGGNPDQIQRLGSILGGLGKELALVFGSMNPGSLDLGKDEMSTQIDREIVRNLLGVQDWWTQISKIMCDGADALGKAATVMGNTAEDATAVAQGTGNCGSEVGSTAGAGAPSEPGGGVPDVPDAPDVSGVGSGTGRH